MPPSQCLPGERARQREAVRLPGERARQREAVRLPGERARQREAVRLSGELGDRGSVTVEYTVLLVLVAIGCALAVAALGVPVVQMFLVRQTWLLLPVP